MEACHLYKIISASLASDPESALSSLKEPADAVAIIVHAWALHSGLKFVGLSQKFETNEWFKQEDLKVLNSSWRKGSPNYYKFKYITTQDKLLDILIVEDGGSKLSICGTLWDQPTSTSPSSRGTTFAYVDICSLVNQSVFQRPDGTEEMPDLYKSDSEVETFCNNLTTNIYDPLIGSESSEKQRETEPAMTEPIPERVTTGSALRETLMRGENLDEYSRSSTPNETPDPIPFIPSAPQVPATRRPPPSAEIPPGFDDEYEMTVGGHPSRPEFGRFGPNFGDSDLYPPGLGPHPEMRPSLTGGMQQPTGGMHPTFDDPLFQNPGRGEPEGGVSDLQRPSGARWDPPAPGMGGGRPGGGDRRGSRGGGFGSQFGGPGFGPTGYI